MQLLIQKLSAFIICPFDDTQDTCDQEILDDDAQMSALLLELADSLN